MTLDRNKRVKHLHCLLLHTQQNLPLLGLLRSAHTVSMCVHVSVCQLCFSLCQL